LGDFGPVDPTKGAEARAFAARINADASAPAPTADSATETPDIPEQIKQLGELRDSGLLTDAEFEAKKAELLDRM
jgi:hypothetical protein